MLPGYHLDNGLDVEAMKHDLVVLHAHLEAELLLEKNITPEDKERKDKNFIEIVEIARSLLPDEMILDINLPVNSLLGLSHQEAILLLQNYYDSHGIVKTQQFYKKRDTSFYLNEIFGILDFVHSEHAKQNTTDQQGLSVVTPLPPSPSKRRHTTQDATAQDLDLDMGEEIPALLREEGESNNLLINDMGLLTWDEVHNMHVDNLRKYLIAYAKHKSYTVSDSFIHTNDLEDMRETLVIYIIEHLYEHSSSGIFKNSSDAYIEMLDPIWAYFEHYNIYLAGQDDSDISMVLLLDLPDILNELKSARNQLALMSDDNVPLEASAPIATDVDVSVHNNTHDDDMHDKDDIHMFYPGFDENADVHEEYKIINTIFLNTIQYHKDNLTTDSEDMDRDITSIIGILRECEIEMISDQAICFLLRCYHILGDNDFPIEHFTTRNAQLNRSGLSKIHQNVN